MWGVLGTGLQGTAPRQDTKGSVAAGDSLGKVTEGLKILSQNRNFLIHVSSKLMLDLLYCIQDENNENT